MSGDALYINPWMRCTSEYNYSEWRGHIAVRENVYRADDGYRGICIFCGTYMRSDGNGPWEPVSRFVIQEEPDFMDLVK